MKLKIAAITTDLQQQRAEGHSKDEHIRVLGDQNKQLLDLLEQTEDKATPARSGALQGRPVGLKIDVSTLGRIQTLWDDLRNE